MARFEFVHEGPWVPRGPGQFGLAVSSATPLTVPPDSQAVVLQAEGGDLRYRDDGVAPTGSAGMMLADGMSVFYIGNLEDLQFIEAGGSGGTLNALFYAWQDS